MFVKSPLVLLCALLIGFADADDFFIGTPTCLDLIKPGQSCLVKVRFAPQARVISVAMEKHRIGQVLAKGTPS